MSERAPLMRIGQVAEQLLGEDSPRNRRLVHRLCERGVLGSVRTGQTGDRLVLRQTIDAWLAAGFEAFSADLESTARAMTARERREQRRRERAASAAT